MRAGSVVRQHRGEVSSDVSDAEGLRSHDQGFVPTTPDRVFRLLLAPAEWERWWPTARARGGSVALGRGFFVVTEPHDVRPGVGLRLRVPRPEGELEWFLEPWEEGTIVNVFLDVHVGESARGRRRLLRLRAGIRRALVALQEAV